jgi:hypothetical protein
LAAEREKEREREAVGDGGSVVATRKDAAAPAAAAENKKLQKVIDRNKL